MKHDSEQVLNQLLVYGSNLSVRAGAMIHLQLADRNVVFMQAELACLKLDTAMSSKISV